jgi:hypothetical protein
MRRRKRDFVPSKRVKAAHRRLNDDPAMPGDCSLKSFAAGETGELGLACETWFANKSRKKCK